MKYKITILILAFSTLIALFSFKSDPSQYCKDEKTYYSLEEALKNPLEVKKLDIAMQKLTSIPPEIGKLENLECLDLSFNKISNLPEEIKNLKKLKYLNLCGTRYLSGVPEILKSLQSLECLDISDHPEWSKDKFEKAKIMLPNVKLITISN